MFQPVKNFLAQLRELFRVFLPPFSGYGCIAGLPVLQRALADGIILTQRSKIFTLLEGLLDTGLPALELSDHPCN